jgi:uncharacterized metal-binding protein YceD (DUF177 family)
MSPFEIRVASVEETPARFELESTAAWWEASRELFERQGGEAPRSVRVRLALEGYRIGRRLLFRGELEATLGLTCSFCIEPIDFPVRERVELLLEPSQNADRLPEGGIALDPEDIGLGQYAGDALDFGGLILEILALAWPMAPRESDRCPDRCPRFAATGNPERIAGGEKNRPFAGLDALLQARREQPGRKKKK